MQVSRASHYHRDDRTCSCARAGAGLGLAAPCPSPRRRRARRKAPEGTAGRPPTQLSAGCTAATPGRGAARCSVRTSCGDMRRRWCTREAAARAASTSLTCPARHPLLRQPSHTHTHTSCARPSVAPAPRQTAAPDNAPELGNARPLAAAASCSAPRRKRARPPLVGAAPDETRSPASTPGPSHGNTGVARHGPRDDVPASHATRLAGRTRRWAVARLPGVWIPCPPWAPIAFWLTGGREH